MWKYLRIAVTAVSLLVCVLLILLWVRSYYQRDFVSFPLDSRFFNVLSDDGIVCATFGEDVQFFEAPPEFRTSEPTKLSWSFQSNEWYLLAATPYWFWLSIMATIAALPWIKWRFSLRTLLIVMTLFSLFFGAIAWSMRG